MKLNKTSKKYLSILYAIWELLTYYTKLFKLDVPTDATKLPVKLFVDDDNITHLYVKIPKVKTPDPYYKDNAIKTIFNEYLNIVLLPAQPELPPFSAGNSVYDMVDCLYVHNISQNNKHMVMDVIYVDNMQAFRLIKSDRKVMEI